MIIWVTLNLQTYKQLKIKNHINQNKFEKVATEKIQCAEFAYCLKQKNYQGNHKIIRCTRTLATYPYKKAHNEEIWDKHRVINLQEPFFWWITHFHQFHINNWNSKTKTHSRRQRWEHHRGVASNRRVRSTGRSDVSIQCISTIWTSTTTTQSQP